MAERSRQNEASMDWPDVRLGGFTPTTYEWIAALVEERWGHPPLSFGRPTVIPYEHAAALFFVLRATPDDEFPGGKWATLQHLEALVEQALGVKP